MPTIRVSMDQFLFHESAILKPLDRSLRDSNAWPDFTLTHVRISKPGSNKNSNLLYASDKSPVVVTGRLDSLPNDRIQYLLPRVTLPTTVEVTNVGLFSYGQYEEGEVALWAAGEAGWFEIKPSRAYKEVYREMVQAVGCLYFAADLYRELDKRWTKNTTPENVFEKYAEEPPHKCRDAEKAAEIFRKHRRFLLTSMEKGKEGITWKQTQLHSWLSKERADDDASEDDPMPNAKGRLVNEETPRRNPLLHAGKGKSILRPQSGVLSIKGANRRRSLETVDAGEEESMMEGAADTTMNSHVEGASPSPLLKRKGRQRQGGRAARRRLGQALDIGKEDSELTQLPDDSDVAQQPERPLPLISTTRPRNAPKPKSIVHIIETPLPSYDPQGPGDTWTCTFDGCSHRVYGASAPESRELIKEHFRGHAFGAQAQIDLVYKEERPYLPVGNLIKKIRDLAALQRGSEPAEGGQAEAISGWPSPVVRKY